MSINVTNLFAFSRSLPKPFDSISNKKVAVTSKYGEGTQSTLSASVIKAINAICRCFGSSGEGAVGVIDHRNVAEYKSSVGPDAYHLVVYDSVTGSVIASVYDKNTEVIEVYTMNQNNRDGAAVIMALFPTLIKDAEFQEAFDQYYSEYLLGYADMKKATDSMAILCDNAYRRIKDSSCSAHVKVEVDKSGNLMRISQTQLDSGAFTPTFVTAGEFTIFAKTERAKKVHVPIVEHKDFIGKFELHSRSFSSIEKSFIPEIPEWYIIPQEVVDICKHASGTTAMYAPMRNFLLRGPAGTGKTMGAKAIAAGLGLPYMKYTCSAGTEIFDFIGQIFPDTGKKAADVKPELRRENEQLKAMGGINYANVAKLLQLPDLDDMAYDPCGVYRELTGMDNETACVQDCMSIVLEKVTEKIKELNACDSPTNKEQGFTYVETDFIKALKNGYLVEIQEPTTIVQPGVLVGLNSLLEQGGSITLPTGEVIKRHPDAVVVITTNVNYEGCREMNQSIIDRMSLVRDVELPSPDIMVQRAMSITGFTDECQVMKMVQVVNDMAEYCKNRSISDGTIGMRSLIDWIISSEITGDFYQSALYTVISKATADEIEREELKSSVLEPIFAPTRKAA